MAKETQVPKTIEGECPSCGYRGSFKHIGSQVWPQEVADNLGVSNVIELYQCENCLTTVSRPTLIKDS